MTNPTYRVQWTCPHCGLTQSCPQEIPFMRHQVLAYCDIEEGGCDKQVVLDVTINVSTRVLKIEEPGAA